MNFINRILNRLGLRKAQTPLLPKSEIDYLVRRAKEEAQIGAFPRTAIEIYYKIKDSPKLINDISLEEDVALAFGYLMTGDVFNTSADILRATGLTYFFLTRAKSHSNNPYLYMYRFSLLWEYNKVFYHLFSRAGLEEFPTSSFDRPIKGYEKRLQVMQISDVLQEPFVLELDPALRNIFTQTYSLFRNIPKEKILFFGVNSHLSVYRYLKERIDLEDFAF